MTTKTITISLYALMLAAGLTMFASGVTATLEHRCQKVLVTATGFLNN
jgi:hypothetical protein